MDHEQTLPTTPATQVSPITVTQTPTDAPAPEEVQTIKHSSGDSNNGGPSHEARPHPGRTSSTHLLGGSEGYQTHSRSQDNPYTDFERTPVPGPVRSRDHGDAARLSSRRHTVLSNSGFPPPHRNTSGIDWIVPVEEKVEKKRTIGERLQPTIDHAVIERDKYAKKALWTGYALNIATGVQVLLGALTTGISAAVTSIKQAQVSTAILGGLTTLVASYLARARSSGEPELSITRVKDLEQFLRETRAFQLDHAHAYGTPENGLNERLDDIRRRFEELLGNANGERRLSPVGITQTQAVP